MPDRRTSLPVVCFVLLFVSTLSAAPPLTKDAAVPASPGVHWVGSWACAPVPEPPKIKQAEQAAAAGPRENDTTVRDVVHLSLGGKVIRLRFSNEPGTTPLKLGPVRVGFSAGAGAVVPGSDRAVTFAGAASTSIPAGKFAYSDPVTMDVPAFADLAVSAFVPRQPEATVTVHATALSSNYFAAGDQTAAPKLTGATQLRSWIYLDGVDVQAPPAAAAIVAYGDSITDGMRSTVDANRRWPDDLARRLAADPATAELAVLNLGISGNRVLYPQAGPPLVARLDRDVFAQAGVKYLILFAGINDINHSSNRPDASQKEAAPDIIAGMKSIVARAHAHGIKVFGATITPEGGSQFASANGEKMRTEINAWIRTGGGFDGVFDFDKVVRDPADPTKNAPPYNSPDHTHLPDAGYQALADSIDLSVFH